MDFYNHNAPIDTVALWFHFVSHKEKQKKKVVIATQTLSFTNQQ